GSARREAAASAAERPGSSSSSKPVLPTAPRESAAWRDTTRYRAAASAKRAITRTDTSGEGGGAASTWSGCARRSTSARSAMVLIAASVRLDDEDALELSEIDRRCHDRFLIRLHVRLLDVDDGADHEALGVQRADLVVQRQSGGDDHVAGGDLPGLGHPLQG